MAFLKIQKLKRDENGQILSGSAALVVTSLYLTGCAKQNCLYTIKGEEPFEL